MKNQFMMMLKPLSDMELDALKGGKVTKTVKTTTISPDGTITLEKKQRSLKTNFVGHVRDLILHVVSLILKNNK